MSEAAATERPRARWPGVVGWLLAVAAVAFSAWIYWGLGPRPKARTWWEPSAALTRSLSQTSLAPLVEELPSALAGFGIVALALAAAVFATTRSALARFLAVFSVLVTVSVVFYAIEARFVWSFFHWRWSASMALLAATLAAALTAPLLAASWLRLGWPLRLALYLPILAGVVVYERNVTGTDPGLRFAISPWPVVQVFGFELGAAVIGTLLFGVGVGLAAVARARRGGGGAALWLAAAAVASLLPMGMMALAAYQELLPFAAGAGSALLLGTLALAVFAIAAHLGLGGDAARTSARALVWTVGGGLVLLPIAIGQTLARLDYTRTRDGDAQQIIQSLERYRAREGAFPDELAQLVEAGDLQEIPEPHIGFRSFGRQQFVYQNFGDSYLLEFSAPRWIQCAYNPPYALDEDEEPSPEDDGLGSGQWSCPSKPPELW